MTKKEIAKDFLKLASSGLSRQAFELYVSDDFIHHNAFFRGDRQTLMIAMEESHLQSPNKVFEIQNVLEDGNLVAAHSYVQQVGENGWKGAVMHIFRFDNDKIVELWDFGQAVPENMVNENGMF